MIRLTSRGFLLVGSSRGAGSADHRRLVGHRARDRARCCARRASSSRSRRARSGEARGARPPSSARTRVAADVSSARRTASGSSPSTRSGSAGSTCSSTRPASGSRAASRTRQSKHLDLQLGVNLRGLVLVTQAAIPLLRRSKRLDRLPRVDRAARSRCRCCPIYAATKAAVISLTRSLNADARRRRRARDRDLPRASSTRRWPSGRASRATR